MRVEDFKMSDLAGDVRESRNGSIVTVDDDLTMAKEIYLRDLPLHVIEDIVNRLEDGRYIAWVQFLGKDWRDAGKNVRSLRFIVLDVYHERARDNNSVESLKPDAAGPSTSRSVQPKTGRPWDKPFKETFCNIPKDKICNVQLRIEVEGKLQSITVPEGERRRTDFWLTDPWFLRQWPPGMGSTLQHLRIVDFGQQAIMRMFFSTPVKDVVMHLPKLEKLQLKMQCPQKLIILASALKYVAFNLEVFEPSKVDLTSMVGLRELLYGARSFITLSGLFDMIVQDLERISTSNETSRAMPSFVYQYLLGFDIDKGGSKAYSSGSLDFRDIYISIDLFRGSYIWIKSRDVAHKGVYCRSTKDRQGRIILKYEPRFKPPREKGLGPSKPQNWIYLGQFDTYFDAKILYRISAFYYGKGEGQLDLGDGSFFRIPLMEEEEQSLCGTAKVKWVKVQAKRVFEEFKKVKAARNLPPTSREPQGKDDVAELYQEMLPDFEAEKEDGQVNMEGCIDDQGYEFNSTSSQLQQPFLANQTLDVGMNIAMQGQSAQLTPNDGFIFNTSNQVELLHLLVNNQHLVQHLVLQTQQQILDLQSELQRQQRLHQQELQESKLQAVQLRQQIFELQQQQHLHQQIQEFNIQS